MTLEEVLILFNDVSDVTIISNIENYIMFYQNDSFDISLFTNRYLPIYHSNINKSFIELFPGIVKEFNSSKEDILNLIFQGMMILYEKSTKKFYFLELISRDVRNTQDSLEEPESITGPRDGFVENIKINITLLRQRIKDENLVFEELKLGKRSKTQIDIISVKDITNISFLNQVKYMLSKIDCDAILTLEDVTTVFQKNCIMPQYLYIGYPDIASRRLLDGQILIFIDNIPTCICLLNTISSFLRNRVEQVNIPLYSIYERIFLYFSIFIAVFLLPLMTCFLTYQSDSLALQMILKIKTVEQGVFFPIYIEMFFVLFLFELYYIVSFKSPKLTLSSMVVMVGGIIIGQNTIESGMVSVFIMTFVALCFLATFTISSNVTFVMSLSLLRILLLLSTIFLGIVGFTLASFYIICKISQESIFNIDFLYPFVPFKSQDLKNVVLFDSSQHLNKRPKQFNVINRKKKK